MLQVKQPAVAQSWAREDSVEDAVTLTQPFMYPRGFRLSGFCEGWIPYGSLLWVCFYDEFAKGKHKYGSEMVGSQAAAICVVEELKIKDSVGSRIGNCIIWWN